MVFVVTIGVLSFFADFTYEGARSINGQFLQSLKATSFEVGVILGIGELLGYGLRAVSGCLADATRQFWPIMIFGYTLQMISVPSLALVSTWPQAAALIIAERVGRAIRNPARDVMLSNAGSHIGGYGWAFGIHEAFDQCGALLGPLLLAAVFAHQGNYRSCFQALVIPAAINLCCVAFARLKYPTPEELRDAKADEADSSRLPRRFWIYLAGAALVAAGFADYGLIAYHFAGANVMSKDSIPIVYAVAMAASGGGSLALGRVFDRYGMWVLIILTVVAAASAPMLFLGTGWIVWLGAAIWGVGIGVHESMIPAAVTPMVPSTKRASAFGIFTAGYGLAWFLGSAAIGWLYGLSVGYVVAFSVLLQLAALPFLFAAKGTRPQPAAQQR